MCEGTGADSILRCVKALALIPFWDVWRHWRWFHSEMCEGTGADSILRCVKALALIPFWDVWRHWRWFHSEMCEGTGADSILRCVKALALIPFWDPALRTYSPAGQLRNTSVFCSIQLRYTTVARIPRYRTDRFSSHSLWTLSILHGHSVQRGRAFFSSMLLYGHRTLRFIRDGSPGRPPPLSHSSWTQWASWDCCWCDSSPAKPNFQTTLTEQFKTKCYNRWLCVCLCVSHVRQCCVQAHVLFCRNDLRSVRAIRYYFSLFYHVLKRLVFSMSSEPRGFFFFFWGGGGGGGGGR